MIADVLTNGQDLFGVTILFRAGHTLSPKQYGDPVMVAERIAAKLSA
jgi:hypothetical protein